MSGCLERRCLWLNIETCMHFRIRRSASNMWHHRSIVRSWYGSWIECPHEVRIYRKWSSNIVLSLAEVRNAPSSTTRPESKEHRPISKSTSCAMKHDCSHVAFQTVTATYLLRPAKSIRVRFWIEASSWTSSVLDRERILQMLLTIDSSTTFRPQMFLPRDTWLWAFALSFDIVHNILRAQHRGPKRHTQPPANRQSMPSRSNPKCIDTRELSC